MSPDCGVCDGPGGETHFGGVCCRSCAAFFRRFFYSKKILVKCSCSTRAANSHPCRSCRIQKCFKIGMKAEKVQPMRDKHCRGSQKLLLSETLPPIILSRDSYHITWTVDSWGELEIQRAMLYGDDEFISFYKISSKVNPESQILWHMVETIFPKVKELRAADKRALLANFIPKWWQLGPIFSCVRDIDNLNHDSYQQDIVGFYSGCFRFGKELSEKEILRIFEPFYWFFHFKIKLPIIQKSFEPTEFMAILWLAFFDSAYTNISEECSKVCQSVRNVILRELRGYQTDKNYADTRIVEAMEALPIVERAVEKFEEELLICEMNGVVIHEDFMEVMRQQRI